ncbi:MAG: hypothetical protein KAJ19_12190, partial [Gammaproteobacteria bacterium]|nr:hypothetical protein [Gammaproteobacteria bacterium]
LRSPVIPPLQDSKPDWRIWQLLANQIGYAQQFPWESEKALYEEFLRPSGIGIEDFFSHPNGIFFGRSPNRLSDSDKDYKFQTPTGKIEASSTITEKHGYSPLPNWHSLSIVKTDTITGSPYPLLLTTGPRNVAYTHSRERNIPQLKKITPAPRVAIHPKTAQIRNIFNNQPVMLKNDKGQMEGIAYITSGIREDTIMVPHGWEKPSNCNNLIDSDLSSMDRVSGFPSYRFAYCEIFPIDQ